MAPSFVKWAAPFFIAGQIWKSGWPHIAGSRLQRCDRRRDRQKQKPGPRLHATRADFFRDNERPLIP